MSIENRPKQIEYKYVDNRDQKFYGKKTFVDKITSESIDLTVQQLSNVSDDSSLSDGDFMAWSSSEQSFNFNNNIYRYPIFTYFI